MSERKSGWSREFDEPITLSDGGKLVTLRDARTSQHFRRKIRLRYRASVHAIVRSRCRNATRNHNQI